VNEKDVSVLEELWDCREGSMKSQERMATKTRKLVQNVV
jgi:hypothetical protein